MSEWNNEPAGYRWQSDGDAGGNWVRVSDGRSAMWQSQGDAGGVYLTPEGTPLQSSNSVGGGDAGIQALVPAAPAPAPAPVAPVVPVAPAAPNYSAQLAQFAGGMLNRGPIGVPNVSAFTNYANTFSMPNAGSQRFSFINPGNTGGLLGSALGSMSNAQPFGAALSGGLLGGAK